ncbi:DUF1611 domain-containing protein [Picrophilus oshimae]|uniref:DUF1611 domain-containing protein n=1 Tax=Picrophilus torridus (strain ATCC 700027 / DSM 9790 / JCM 10055 / NBRC 100828 / KAW 2/3) TaxID=1122961 RepID=Q6L1K4_PICTO|nr:DUF1611 domain-containing protein [Picrophilus oshimae]AAT43148.1 hypothetical protein PTO0563 [Picrophilus oshimae DSM 9789]
MDRATLLAEGFFTTTYGKTANGLVRYSKRYDITSVIDSRYHGMDAGMLLMGRPNNIPVISSIKEAHNLGSDTMIIGVATDGGFIPNEYRKYIKEAISMGMNIVSGLHEYLSDDPEFRKLAKIYNVKLIDVRKMFESYKYSFTGRIKDVKSKKIAVLGTDSAIGKRTTAIYLNEAINNAGKKSIMIGTGQTSWMQGFKYTVVMDSIINDFVAGSLEYITLKAWDEERPDYMFLEGQGSIIHPAYPGGFEIIGALRPDAIILQHAPKRKYYDGFPEFEIPPLERYIKVLELISDKPVIAISLNRENMTDDEVQSEKESLEKRYNIPVFDPLKEFERMREVIASL